jgi:hypothetical protein
MDALYGIRRYTPRFRPKLARTSGGDPYRTNAVESARVAYAEKAYSALDKYQEGKRARRQ